VVQNHARGEGLAIGRSAKNPVECGDGLEAIAAFAQHRPDWVLMDIEMKPVDGLAATRQIKAHWPEAKVIFVTSYDQPRFREAASQLKVEGYVIKDNLEQINQIVCKTPGNRKSSI
jgi:DNA-binding NarL/FixJ family response regulator